MNCPDLPSYDWIVVNSSAGKDSQAMLDYVVAQADAAAVPRSRLVVLHCDLGKSPGGEEIEWPGTKELAEEHAKHYGLRFILVKRGLQGFLEKIEGIGFWPRSSTRYCTSFFKRDQGQKVMTALATETRRGFLEEIERRGKWPSSGQRYCTSYYKRDSAFTAMTALANEAREPKKAPRLLQCFGFRAEESPRRRKMKTFTTDKRISNSRKHVDVWLPVHAWTVAQVWDRIRGAGTRHHPAYDRGMTRLSCRFCIFAPKSQLMISARENPALFEEYVQVEQKIGHRFRLDCSLAEVKEAIDKGEAPGEDDGAWNM